MTDIAVIALSLGLEKNHMMQDYQSNRPVRQQPPGRFPNESDRTVERIRKIKKKQFCYSDHDKKVDGFEIIKFDDSCEFDNDRDRTILKRQVGGSTYFYYPDNEFVDASKWQKDTYYVLYLSLIHI